MSIVISRASRSRLCATTERASRIKQGGFRKQDGEHERRGNEEISAAGMPSNDITAADQGDQTKFYQQTAHGHDEPKVEHRTPPRAQQNQRNQRQEQQGAVQIAASARRASIPARRSASTGWWSRARRSRERSRRRRHPTERGKTLSGAATAASLRRLFQKRIADEGESEAKVPQPREQSPCSTGHIRLAEQVGKRQSPRDGHERAEQITAGNRKQSA